MADWRYRGKRGKKKSVAERLAEDKKRKPDLDMSAQETKKKGAPKTPVAQQFTQAAEADANQPTFPRYGTPEHKKYFQQYGDPVDGIVHTGTAAGEAEMRTLPNYMMIVRDEDGDIRMITPPAWNGPLPLDSQEKIDAAIPTKRVDSAGNITYTSAYGTVIDRKSGTTVIKTPSGALAATIDREAPSEERLESTLQPRAKAARQKKEMEKKAAHDRRVNHSLKRLALFFAASAEHAGKSPEEIMQMLTEVMENKPAAPAATHSQAAPQTGTTATTRTAQADSHDDKPAKKHDSAKAHRTSSGEGGDDTREVRPVEEDSDLKVGEKKTDKDGMVFERTKDGWLIYNPNVPSIWDRDKKKGAEPLSGSLQGIDYEPATRQKALDNLEENLAYIRRVNGLESDGPATPDDRAVIDPDARRKRGRDQTMRI